MATSSQEVQALLTDLADASPAARKRGCESCCRLAHQGELIADVVAPLAVLLVDTARAPGASPLNWYAADALGHMAARGSAQALQALRDADSSKASAQRVAGYGLSVYALETDNSDELLMLYEHPKARVREGVFHGLRKHLTSDKLELALKIADKTDLARLGESDKAAQKKCAGLVESMRFILRRDPRGAEPLYRYAKRAHERAQELDVEDDPQILANIQGMLADALAADQTHKEALALVRELGPAAT